MSQYNQIKVEPRCTNILSRRFSRRPETIKRYLNGDYPAHFERQGDFIAVRKYAIEKLNGIEENGMD